VTKSAGNKSIQRQDNKLNRSTVAEPVQHFHICFQITG